LLKNAGERENVANVIVDDRNPRAGKSRILAFDAFHRFLRLIGKVGNPLVEKQRRLVNQRIATGDKAPVDPGHPSLHHFHVLRRKTLRSVHDDRQPVGQGRRRQIAEELGALGGYR